jgi:hypothetical protein
VKLRVATAAVAAAAAEGWTCCGGITAESQVASNLSENANKDADRLLVTLRAVAVAGLGAAAAAAAVAAVGWTCCCGIAAESQVQSNLSEKV